MRDRLCPTFCLLLVLPFVRCDSPERGKPARNSLREYRKQGGDSSTSTLAVIEKEKLRDSLTAEGLYDCCTKPGCLECVERLRQCGCYADIRQKDPICGECLEGYRKGDGRLKLVSIPELVRIGKKGGR